MGYFYQHQQPSIRQFNGLDSRAQPLSPTSVATSIALDAMEDDRVTIGNYRILKAAIRSKPALKSKESVKSLSDVEDGVVPMPKSKEVNPCPEQVPGTTVPSNENKKTASS